MEFKKIRAKVSDKSTLIVTVIAGAERTVVTKAEVQISGGNGQTWNEWTDKNGNAVFKNLFPGTYTIQCKHMPESDDKAVEVESNTVVRAEIHLVPDLKVELNYLDRNGSPTVLELLQAHDRIDIEISGWPLGQTEVRQPAGFSPSQQGKNQSFVFTGLVQKGGRQTLDLTFKFPSIDTEGSEAWTQVRNSITASDMPSTPISGKVGVTLSRTATEPTKDVALWAAIRKSTEALSFNNYLRFMDWIFCGKEDPSLSNGPDRSDSALAKYKHLRDHKRFLPFTDAEAYRVVKAATEAFVMVNCGVHEDHAADYLDRRDLPAQGLDFDEYLEPVDGSSALPYLAVIRRKLPDIPIKKTLFENAEPDGAVDDCFGLLQEKLANPCFLELIWSYWHEEGMLVQTANAISWRFQNRRSASPRDPLVNLELDPLRPLNNLLWGYIQDEQHRLTVVRRNYEYDHHYGLRLEGQAVQQFNPADTRSKFLEAFHHLLRLCTVFYKQDDDTTVMADAFPVLNALKETHLVLSQGAHNQFGDLPSTARIEMLMQQWLLARPEFREALPTRTMVAYPEPWMDRVDAMKRMQGWSDTSVLHFRNLAIFGEQILLAVRWGHWSDVQEPIQAFNWARFFRPHVQGYLHAYRAATGVDLTTETADKQVDATRPSLLLKRRLALQQRAS